MMRIWIGAGCALLMMTSQIAMAQDHGHDGGGHGGGERGSPSGGGGNHGGPPPGGGNRGGGDFRQQAIGGGDRHDGNRGGGFQGGAGAGRGPGGGFASVHPEGATMRGPGPGFNRTPGGPRGNWFPRPGNNGWHRGWYAGQRGGWQRIRGPRYVYPNGWGYRRWGLGAILPGILFGSAYYWNDYGTYGVYPPPPGDRWVRYGPDLLLINIRTGRVDDAIYGAFY